MSTQLIIHLMLPFFKERTRQFRLDQMYLYLRGQACETTTSPLCRLYFSSVIINMVEKSKIGSILSDIRCISLKNDVNLQI